MQRLNQDQVPGTLRAVAVVVVATCEAAAAGLVAKQRARYRPGTGVCYC